MGTKRTAVRAQGAATANTVCNNGAEIMVTRINAKVLAVVADSIEREDAITGIVETTPAYRFILDGVKIPYTVAETFERRECSSIKKSIKGANANLAIAHQMFGAAKELTPQSLTLMLVGGSIDIDVYDIPAGAVWNNHTFNFASVRKVIVGATPNEDSLAIFNKKKADLIADLF